MMILGNATTTKPQAVQEGSDLRIHSRVARQLVDIEILYLLNFGAKSGYELRKSLSKSFGIKVSYGTLYPHLHALERSQLIAGTWSSSTKEEAPARSSLKKRVYDLTSHGAMVLKESIEKLGRISMTMQLLLNNVDLRQSKIANQNSTELVNSIASILSKHELALESSSNEKGASGLEHSIELLARSNNGSKILIRVINGEEDKFDLDQAFKVLVVSNDIQARTFLLASPPLRREVSDLCNFYHMKLFEGDTWDVVLSALDQGLSP